MRKINGVEIALNPERKLISRISNAEEKELKKLEKKPADPLFWINP